jgi:hypothetical protein
MMMEIFFMWVVDWCMREVVVVAESGVCLSSDTTKLITIIMIIIIPSSTRFTQIMCGTESRGREMDVLLLGAHLHETELYLKPKSLNCLWLN